VGEVDVVLADWWQEFSQASDAVREDLVAQLRTEQHKGQRRVRASRPPENLLPDGPETAERAPYDEQRPSQPQEGEAAASDAPRKRRRRRRKPVGDGSARPESAGPQE
jgi:poly(A) polymerase